jgi:hypothetical protein
LGVHLGIEWEVMVRELIILMAENVGEFRYFGKFIHEMEHQDEGVPFGVESGTVFGKCKFSEGGLFLYEAKVVTTD